MIVARILAFALLLAFPTMAHAAVAVNTASSFTAGVATTSTHPHTVSGTETLMVVAVSRDFTATVSSITYAGAALTNLPSCTTEPTDLFGRTEVWYKLSPASGTNNIVVTISTATKFQVGAVSFTGVDQSMVAASFGCTVATPDTSATPSVTVTSATGEMVLAALGVSIEATEAAVASGVQTSRWNGTIVGSIIGAGGTAPGAASVVMFWTLPEADSWAMTGIRIRPSGPADTQAPTAPTNVLCTAQTSASIRCTWTASTDNVAVIDYLGERSTTGCGGTFSTLDTSGSTSYTDSGLTANTAYCYRWYARDGTNTSAVSNTSSATTLAGQQATLTWTNQAAYTNIVVSRCAGTSCSPSDLQTISGSLTTFIDTTSPTPVAGYSVRGQTTGKPDTASSNIIYTSPLVPPAVLSVAPPSLVYNATVGAGNPPSQTLVISNSPGSQTMNWTVIDDVAWLSCLPSSGTDTTGVTCSVNIAGLSAGTPTATITVTAAGATGSPKTVPVTLNLSPAATPGGTVGTGSGGRIR